MGLGNFVQGFQGGLEAAQTARANRQMERIRDAGIRRIEDEDAQLREDWAYKGFDPEDWSDYSTADPLWERLSNWAQSRGKRRRALPLASMSADMLPTEPQLQDVGVDEYAMPEFADGGKIDMEAINRRQYRNARMDQARQAVSRGAERVAGAARSAIPREVGIDRLGGVTGEESVARRLGRRAIGAAKGAGVGYLAGGAASGALDAFGTPTETMASEMGLDYNNRPDGALGAAYDVGVRTVGTARRVGDALMRPFRSDSGSSKAPVRTALPVAASSEGSASRGSALPVAASSKGPASRGGARGTAMQEVTVGARRGGGSALPSAQEPVDLSDISPEEIPDFRVEDWTQHRTQLLRSMMRGKRMPLADAMQAVDTQVMQMQQQGFTNYAQQAMAMLQGGNLRGAAAALRTAYQYLPTGKDVRFGIQNGKLYALTIDEATGKPVGKPTEVQPELIYAITDNMRKEGAWQQYAKDRREFQQKLRQYAEIDRPLAEAQGSALLTNARSNATRAQADMMGAEMALMGGGRDGLKASDYDRAGNYFVEKADEFAFANGLDASASERLAAVMSEAYRRNPSMDARVIVQRVLESARSQ